MLLLLQHVLSGSGEDLSRKIEEKGKVSIEKWETTKILRNRAGAKASLGLPEKSVLQECLIKSV